MSFLPPLALNWEAAKRDVHAKSPKFRKLAAQRLGKALGDEQAFAADGLKTLATDKDSEVRTAALSAIADLGDASLLPTVAASFEDKHQQIRQLAVCVVAELDPEAAKPFLKKLLRDPRPEMRYQAVSQIGAWADHGIDLKASLRDEDAEVRAAAIDALGERADTTTLKELLGDTSDSVRFNASVTLAERGDDSGTAMLLDALKLPTTGILAARALGHLNSPKATSILEEMAQRFFLAPVMRAELGGAIGRNEPTKGEGILKRVIRGWRIEGKNRAIELAAELGLKNLQADIARAASKKGVDKVAAQNAIAILSGRADSPQRGD